MKACGGYFSQGIEPVDIALSVGINLYPATRIVSTWNNRYHIPGYVNPAFQAMLINIGKMIFKSLLIQMSAIEPYMIIAPYFQFIINSPCNYITWSKRSSAVVPVHEFLTGKIFQNGSITA